MIDNTFIKSVVRPMVAVVLLTILFLIVDWNEFYLVIHEAHLLYLFAGGLLFFPSIIISSLRWHIALKHFGILITFGRVARLYLEGTFISNFLPTSFGGDAYKYLVLAKEFPQHKGVVMASMLFERGHGFIALFIANIIALPFTFTLVLQHKVLTVLEALMLGAFLGIIVTIALRNPMLRLLQRVNVRFALYTKAVQFLKVLADVNSIRTHLLLFLCSLIFVGLIVLGQLCYLNAFGASVNVFVLMLIVSIIYVVGILPISLNSIGVTEGLTVFLYSLVSVEPAVALAVALSGRIFVILFSVAGALTYVQGSIRTNREH